MTNRIDERTFLIPQDWNTAAPPGKQNAPAKSLSENIHDVYKYLTDPHCDESFQTKNFDACPFDTVENPSLFVANYGDADAVDMRDVRQNQLGDCFVLAPLTAMAQLPQGRALIRNAITENKNSKGEVESYTVRLYQPPSLLNPWGKYKPVEQTVTPQAASGHVAPRAENGENEVWPVVMEKAVAQYHGGYNAIARGGSPAGAMEVLMGAPVTSVTPGWDYTAKQLKADLAAGKVIVLSTRSSLPKEDYDLSGPHAYAVTGVIDKDGQTCVVLHNPWNTENPQPIPFDKLGSVAQRIHVASFR